MATRPAISDAVSEQYVPVGTVVQLGASTATSAALGVPVREGVDEAVALLVWLGVAVLVWLELDVPVWLELGVLVWLELGVRVCDDEGVPVRLELGVPV